MKNPTLRDIADACSISIATASRAMSGRPYVEEELRKTVTACAARLGYNPNKLVGSLMAHVRRSTTHQFLGNVAIVHVPSTHETVIGPQERRIIDSALARTTLLGFSAEVFELRLGPRGKKALERVLLARGISGVIVVFPEPSNALETFAWDHFSAVALDLSRQNPPFNTVCHDHYASLTSALQQLRAAGYRKAGLFIEHFKDARTNFKWSAALQSFQLRHGGIGRVPVLMPPAMRETEFMPWFRKHRPDVLLGHFDECIEWLGHLKLCVPDDVGFFNLNWQGRRVDSAGLDPQLELQGAAAADVLIAQIQRGERGMPSVPRQILVPGRVVSGPTVRPLPIA